MVTTPAQAIRSGGEPSASYRRCPVAIFLAQHPTAEDSSTVVGQSESQTVSAFIGPQAPLKDRSPSSRCPDQRAISFNVCHPDTPAFFPKDWVHRNRDLSQLPLSSDAAAA